MLELLQNRFHEYQNSNQEEKKIISLMLGSNFSLEPENRIHMHIYSFLEQYFSENLQGGGPDWT